MAKSLSTTSYALLGLLRLQPWSTYELAKQVERSLGWFWPRAERKIYDEAKNLVEHHLASTSQQPTGSRPRTVYEITPQGQEALRNWLTDASDPPKLEAEALVRVFFSDAGTLEQLRMTIEGMAATARTNADELQALIAAADDENYPFADRSHINAIALRFHLDYDQMISDWSRWALAQTSKWNDIDDPGNWDWHTVLT